MRKKKPHIHGPGFFPAGQVLTEKLERLFQCLGVPTSALLEFALDLIALVYPVGGRRKSEVMSGELECSWDVRTSWKP